MLFIIKVIILLIFFYVTTLVGYLIVRALANRDTTKKKPTVFERLWNDYKARLVNVNTVVFHFKISNKKFPLIVLSAVVACGLICWLLTNTILLLFVFLFFSYYVPNSIVDMHWKRRAAKIEAQLIPSLTLLANGVKAGLDVIQGFELIVRDMEPPIKDEFETVLKEYNLGTPFEEALINMRTRLNSKTVNTFTTSLIIQRESGGNITKIIDQIINTIRESFKLDNKVKTLTSQGRMQAKVVLALPWGLAGLLFLIQPTFMMPMFTTTLGIVLVLLVAFWQFVGMIVIRKMVAIEA